MQRALSSSLTRRRVGLRCRITRLHEFDDSRTSVIAPAVPGHARHAATTMPFTYAAIIATAVTG
jgi:hypothetical protein